MTNAMDQKPIRRTRKIAVAVGLISLFGTGICVTPAEASALSFWNNDYYYNHFASLDSCNSWGGAITSPTNPNYIPGALNWACVRHSGQSKYSMNVLFAT